MAEIALRFLRYLPRYLREFGSLLSGPKRFMSRKQIHTERSFIDSLHFLILSLVITVAARAPLLPPEADLWVFFGSQSVLCLMSVVLFSLSLRLSWRIVGGKAVFRSFFVACAYFFGVIFVIFVFVTLTAEGVFKFFDLEFYKAVRDAIKDGTPRPTIDEPLKYILGAILAIEHIALAIWYITGWGAYRQLNGLSKRRSLAALLISAPFNALAMGAVFFMANALA